MVINMVKRIINMVGVALVIGTVWVIKKYKDWSELEELDVEY